jgi:uncharacterized protein (DUF2141 family)
MLSRLWVWLAFLTRSASGGDLLVRVSGISANPGVSNNLRPRFRAPRFEVACFPARQGEATTLRLRIAR